MGKDAIEEANLDTTLSQLRVVLNGQLALKKHEPRWTKDPKGVHWNFCVPTWVFVLVVAIIIIVAIIMLSGGLGIPPIPVPVPA
ncbi:MAG: hypothetical protein QOC81_1687 [Thermoanaerobaculia bacterium]|jgi:hypothetical protein|nr:hypothetical protein [Thermoanaerobaculia bacterium]